MATKVATLVSFCLLLMISEEMLAKPVKADPFKESTKLLGTICTTNAQCIIPCARRRLIGICVAYYCTCVGGFIGPGIAGGRVVGPYGGGVGSRVGGPGGGIGGGIGIIRGHGDEDDTKG